MSWRGAFVAVAMAGAAVLTLAACGGDDDPGDASVSEETGSSEDPSDAAGADQPPVTAIETAERLAEAVRAIEETTEITEDNDPNDLIGRPGGYDTAAVITDRRVEACDDLGAACGASIEQFPNEDEARSRSDYILELLDAGGPAFGTEYHFLDGNQLLRVWGDLKPSEAEQYEQVFGGEALN